MGTAATAVEIGLFGSLCVEADGDPVTITGDRQQRLLARLALAKGAPVPRAALASAVWGAEDAPTDPDTGIRTYVGRLRRSLGDHAGIVETTDGGYRLADAVSSDVDRFDTHVRRGRTLAEGGEAERAISELAAALHISERRLLEPWATEAWVLGEAERRAEARLSAAGLWAELQIGLGYQDAAVEQLTPLSRVHPHHEGIARRLAAALHAQGRSGDALRVISECRRRLATDLGLDPSGDLVHLEAAILGQRPTTAPSKQHLRSYELGERLGEGSFSIVYRGRQPAVDRDVAIKVIRAELANEADFVRRFESEAHLVARLEHPHIVPLYDFWREPDAAYLVMRWLRGGTLHARLLERPLTIDEVVTLVDDIGGALTLAHRTGVVHRDVKPANVFLDEAGRFYLGDFGIAVDSQYGPDPVAALSLGSPAYASPEQLERRPVTPSTDVYGLALTVYEALSGHLPFSDASGHADLLQRKLHDDLPPLLGQVPGLPAGVDDVLTAATLKDPDVRTRTVEDFAEEFRAAVAPDAGRPSRPAFGTATLVGDLTCPYVGLAAFDEGDATRFFGRSRLSTEVIDRIRDHRMVMVVGPSGSGKSSLVRAGVVPRLRDGALRGSERWFVVTMTPGDDPYDALEAALLRVAVNPPTSLREQLLVDDRGISRCVRRSLPDDEAELLLVIDQFEELFTLSEDEAMRRSFLRALVTAVGDDQVRVVATIRADHYDRPLRHAELGRIMRDGTIPITPLAPDELERVIVDPAARAGVEFEPGLVPTIVAEVNDQPGALPLLQFTLTRLWDHQVSGLLTMEAYRQLGGVSGSLASEAERLYVELEPDARRAARPVFQQLVTPGEGRGDTRRRALRAELVALDHAESVLDAFGEARLLLFDRDHESRRPTVEVAHEALLREWPRLKQWIDEDRDGLRIHRQLTAAAAGWVERDRDPGELYRSGRLEAAKEYATDAQLTEDEQAFLDAGIVEAHAEAETKQRRVRRLRRLAVATGVIALVAIAAGLVAFTQQRRADDNAAEARAASAFAETEAERANEAAEEALAQAKRAENALADAEVVTLISRSAALVDENPTASLLLAVEAYDRDPGNRTMAALASALGARAGETLRIGLDPVAHLHCDEGAPAHSDYLPLSVDGWVGWYQGGLVTAIDPATGERLLHTTQPDPCGGVFWTHADGPVVHEFDGAAHVERVPGSGEVTKLVEGSVAWGAVTSAGTDAVVAVLIGESLDGLDLHLFGADDQPIASPLDLDIDLVGTLLSPSGRYGLAFDASFNELQGHTLQLIDVATGRKGWLADLPAQLSDISFNPADTLVAVSDKGGTISLFDVSTGNLESRFGPGGGAVSSVAFLDNRRVALATSTGIEVWDTTDGGSREQQIPLAGALGVRAVTQEKLSVVTTGDQELVVLDLEQSGLARTVASVPPGARVYLAQEGIGAIATIAAAEGELIDLRSGETATHSLTVPDAGVVVGISPGDATDEYLAFTIDGSIGRFEDGELVDTLHLSDDAALTIRHARGHRTPDGGRRVAIHLSDAGLPGSDEVFLVDLVTFEVVFSVVDGCPCTGAVPSPDGDALVLDTGAAVVIHTADGQARTLEVQSVASSGRTGSVNHAVDPAADRILRGSSDGVVEIIDVRTGASRMVADFGVAATNLAFIDETRAVVLTLSGDAWLIDTKAAQRIGLVWAGGAGDVTSGTPTVSLDGDLLWIPTSSEIVEVPLSPDTWRELACALAGRDLTAEERDALIPGDVEPSRLCPAND